MCSRPPHVVRALRALPGCRLINGYGPTENTTFSCCYTIPHDYSGAAAVPIGRAIRGTEALVLGETLRPLAAGEDGELYVGGAGLALGYFNRPELTARAFVPHPQQPGAQLYRTGDRVRARADGNLEFLGRIDRQVKINGKRVELDEIEARLRATGLVQDAAVICPPAQGAAPRHIAAFVTAPSGDLDLGRLRAALREELPDYMIPAMITVLPALPLSPTGKLDRARLAQLTATRADVKDCTPGNSTESLLLQVWKRVLARNDIGLEDNFFDLGGTSLGLLEVHASISRSLASDLTVVEMFRVPKNKCARRPSDARCHCDPRCPGRCGACRATPRSARAPRARPDSAAMSDADPRHESQAPAADAIAIVGHRRALSRSGQHRSVLAQS